MHKLQPVILSGGSGTRLWPLSREHYPKQLLAPFGDLTLLQATVERLAGLDTGADDDDQGVAAPLVVCSEEHRFLVAEQLRRIGLSPGRLLLEPVGRNTAPAATLAALHVASADSAAVLLIMPADHLIQDPTAFHAAVQCGIDQAAQGAIVTFGIVPDRPETGYGYIRKGVAAVTGGGITPYPIAGFVEKPDAATARACLDTGEYLWNSGIFMVRADVWLDAIRRFRPDIYDAAHRAHEAGRQDGDFFRIGTEEFTACPSDSIDYAVMERLVGPAAASGAAMPAVVIPLDAGWSDVGSWSSLWEVIPQDADGNILRGDVIAVDTQGSLLFAEHRLLAAVGLNDIIAIETADAVLVAHRDHAQSVRQIVQRIKAAGRTEHQMHRRVHRPWGSYEGIDSGDRFQVKRICVNPGASLSLQMHHYRAEHWIVVRGTAKVVRGDESFLLSENESTYIPIGVRHRLENPGSLPLEIIEVQSGSYLGEDDIVRYDDHYGRK